MGWKPLVHIITPDTDERGLLRAQLLGADHDVRAFARCDQASSRLSDGIPHLVIMDQRTAERWEKEFTSYLQRLEDASPLPFLFLLDPDRVGSVPPQLREGLDDTLVRPVTALELMARVRSCLRNRQHLAQVRVQEAFLRHRGLSPYSLPEGLPTVLLVEEEAGERERISRLLEGIPCAVIATGSLAEALIRVRHQPPEMVIMDLLASEQEGLDLCRHLKGQEETRNIPLLMLTSFPELDNRFAGLASSPDDYLVKPANPAEVLIRAGRLLARSAGCARLAGNLEVMREAGLADRGTGIPGEDFFRFSYPELVRWSEKARLPFTVARLRASTPEAFAALAAVARPTLRNIDMVFATGGRDVSLILPETTSDRGRIALARLFTRIGIRGVPPGDIRSAVVSVGERGWDAVGVRTLLSFPVEESPAPPANGRDRILVMGDGKEAADLVRTLRRSGFPGARPLRAGEAASAGILKARLLIIQGDRDRVAELLAGIAPALEVSPVPVLARYNRGGGILSSEEPRGVDDFVPPGTDEDYLLHRARRMLEGNSQVPSDEMAGFLTRLVSLMEEASPDFLGHGESVSLMAMDLGADMGLPPRDLEALRWGGLLHDVGKLFMPRNLVEQRRWLFAEEFAAVQSHPRLGHDLCRGVAMLEPALPILLYHHERMDGKGYPEGLRGEKIPLLARIVAVVDVYDTLTRTQPFRPAFSGEKAGVILLSEAAKGMWDPAIVERFLRKLRGKGDHLWMASN